MGVMIRSSLYFACNGLGCILGKVKWGAARARCIGMCGAGWRLGYCVGFCLGA